MCTVAAFQPIYIKHSCSRCSRFDVPPEKMQWDSVHMQGRQRNALYNIKIDLDKNRNMLFEETFAKERSPNLNSINRYNFYNSYS